MDYWRAFTASRLCLDELNASGIRVRVERNFELVPEIIRASKKGYVTPFLDPAKNDFTSANCFWLCGWKTTDEGEEVPVLLGGARLDDVGNSGPEFLKSAFNRGYGPDCILSVNDSVRQQIRGRAAYFGDLVSRAGSGLGQKNVRYFVCVAHYLAAIHLRADCVYSFMRGRDILLGSADRNGFLHRNPHPLEWGIKPEGRGDNEQLVSRSYYEDEDYFETIIQELACSKSGSKDDRDDLLQASLA